MIDLFELEDRIKKNEIDKCYMFCGIDETSIRKSIEKILELKVNKDFITLNYVEIDGMTAEAQTIINACETLPFMSEKKVVTVYRADFLRDKVDNQMSKTYKEVSNYLLNIPDDCILIMYYIFNNEREKESTKLRKLDKNVCVVKAGKLKGVQLKKKVKQFFVERKKNIGNAELQLFCSSVSNNIDIILNEVEKLCCYTEGREITVEDIKNLITMKSDNDIFNLVDYLSQKKPQKALDVLNEIIFKGESVSIILRMIERQFDLIFNIKLAVEMGKDKNVIAREFRLHPYICEKMMNQSKKFTYDQIRKCMEICLNTEKNLKSRSINEKTEMELLIVNTAMVS